MFCGLKIFRRFEMRSLFAFVASVFVQLAVALTLGSTPALAADIPCGTATAYTAPTSTTAGSVTIGVSTFVLAPGATSVGAPTGTAPQPPPIGFGTCINGPRNAAGAFTAFSFSPLNAGICGAVSGYVPASASAAGSITLTNGTTAPSTLPIAAGVSLASAQVTGNQCFALGTDGRGSGQVTGYISPQGSAPATGVPAPSAPAPTTSTSSVDICGSLNSYSPASATQPNNMLQLSNSTGAHQYQLAAPGTVPSGPTLGSLSTALNPEIVRLQGTLVSGSNTVTNYTVTRVTSCPSLPNTSTETDVPLALGVLAAIVAVGAYAWRRHMSAQ
jgi:hypothetical protein